VLPTQSAAAKATLARRLDIRTVGLSTRTDIAGGSVRLGAEFDVRKLHFFGELMPRLLLLRRLRELLYRSRQHGSKKRRVF